MLQRLTSLSIIDFIVLLKIVPYDVVRIFQVIKSKIYLLQLEFPSLVNLTLSGINVQIFWLDFQPRTISYMDNLKGLDVSACNNLKYLFPFFIAERLVKLEKLEVRDCEVMEDIVVMKNLEEEGWLGKILFPKLYNLTLDKLPALRNFCVGDCIKFESLSELTIEECPQLKTFLTCSTPILEVLVDNEEGNHSAIIQPFFNEKVISTFCYSVISLNPVTCVVILNYLLKAMFPRSQVI